MAASFGAAGAGAITATSGAALTPALPSGVTAGQLLIAHVFYGGSTAAPDTPSGWSVLGGSPYSLDTPGTNGRVWVFGKIAAGGDANPAFGTQAVTTPRRARCYRFTGVLDDVLANVVGGFNFEGPAASTTVSDVGVTTPSDNALAINLIAIADDNSTASFTGETGGNWSVPLGATVYTSTTGTPDTAMQLQTAPMPTAGTVNGGTYTQGASDAWGNIGFYILGAPPRDTPPTIAAFTGAVNTSTTPKTIVVTDCEVDDWLFTFAAGDLASAVSAATSSTTSGSTTGWTEQQEDVASSFCWYHIAAAQVTAAGSVTVQVAATGATQPWGFFVLRARGSDGPGASAEDTTAGSNQSLDLPVSDDSSAVGFVSADFTAGSVGTDWTPNTNDTLVRREFVSGSYTFHGAYWDDQAAGTRAYGSTGGGGTEYKQAALEILGTIGGVAEVDLSPVTMALTPVALDVVAGTVNLDLSPITLALTPQALDPALPPLEVDLSPVTLALSPQALDPVAGTVNLDLSPVILPLTPQALDPVSGVVNLDLSPVSMALSPVALDVVAGTVNLDLAPVVLALTAEPLDPQEVAGAGSVNLDPVTLTLTPQPLDPVSGVVDVDLVPVTLSLVPVALDVVAGVVNLDLAAVSLTLSPQALDVIAGTVNLDLAPVVLVITPQALVPEETVGENVDLAPVVLVLTAVALVPEEIPVPPFDPFDPVSVTPYDPFDPASGVFHDPFDSVAPGSAFDPFDPAGGPPFDPFEPVS